MAVLDDIDVEYVGYLLRMSESPNPAVAAQAKALLPDLLKAGPKGYIHGWIYVGPGHLGADILHPELGRGQLTRVGKKTHGVRFASGAEHAFEHAPETAAAEHFVARVSKPRGRKPAAEVAKPTGPAVETGHVARDAQIRSGWKIGDRLTHDTRGEVIYGGPDDMDSSGRAGSGGAQHVEFDDGNGGMVSADRLSGYVLPPVLPSSTRATRDRIRGEAARLAARNPETPTANVGPESLIRQAQRRQAAIDNARPLAELASRLDEYHHNLGSNDAHTEERTRVLGEVVDAGVNGMHRRNAEIPQADRPPVPAGAETLRQSAHDRVVDDARTLAAAHGITLHGRAGDVVPFDRSRHTLIGGNVEPGTPVEVVRPGASFRHGDENIPLSKSDVFEAPARTNVPTPTVVHEPAPTPGPKVARHEIILPDGTVAKRGSKTNAYTHAVMVTRDNRKHAANLETEADRLAAATDVFEKAHQSGDYSGLKLVPTSYNGRGETFYSSEVPGYEGIHFPDHRAKANQPQPWNLSAGRTTPESVRDYYSNNQIRDNRQSAAKLRQNVQTLRDGPAESHYITRWSKTRRNADNALGDAGVVPQSSAHRARVVEVGTDLRIPAKPAEPASDAMQTEADRVRRAAEDRVLAMGERPGAPMHMRVTAENIRARRAAGQSLTRADLLTEAGPLEPAAPRGDFAAYQHGTWLDGQANGFPADSVEARSLRIYAAGLKDGSLSPAQAVEGLRNSSRTPVRGIGDELARQTGVPAAPVRAGNANRRAEDAIRAHFPAPTGEVAMLRQYSYQIDSALDNPDYDKRSKELNRLIGQVGEPRAYRIAWEAESEAHLANHLLLQQPEPEDFDPYADLPPMPGAEIAQGKLDTARELKERFANKKIVIRMRDDGLAGVLRDGRIKNAFETGRSGGDSKGSASYREKRARAEQVMFGIPTDTDPAKRPIYGYLVDDVQPVGADTETGHGSPGAYGDIQVVLKDSVRPRTTASVGDSMDDHVLPSPIDDPQWYSTNHVASRYDEAQVHGGAAASDIAEVVFPSQPSGAMRKQLTDAGVPWRVASANPTPSPARIVSVQPGRAGSTPRALGARAAANVTAALGKPTKPKIDVTETARDVLRRLNSSTLTTTPADNFPLLKQQPVAVLRELARIHGIVGHLGGRDTVARMKKPDLVREMAPWFS